ncbi:serine hydrolase [Deinococcus cellulosilyticus]|nr:serine hydrolase [Deinococcus cellulosilyticus]
MWTKISIGVLAVTLASLSWMLTPLGGQQEASSLPQLTPVAQAAPVHVQKPVCYAFQPRNIPHVDAPTPPSRLQGKLGLFVAEVDPVTLAFKRVVSRDANSSFPLASTYKQAVMYELARQVDQGEVSLKEIFDVTQSNHSLGEFPYDGSDVNTLAVRMIKNSDNTATDILQRRVGLRKVQANIDALNLCKTRMIMTTKGWWTAQASMSPMFPKNREALLKAAEEYGKLRGEALYQKAEALDQDAQKVFWLDLDKAITRYFESDRYDPRVDLNTHNVSTPAELAVFLSHEFLRNGLNPQTDKWFREVMATAPNGSRLALPHEYFGGKGGNGWRILTYSGYLLGKDGKHYVYAFLNQESGHTYTMRDTGAAFIWINQAFKALQALPEASPPALQASPQGNAERGTPQ